MRVESLATQFQEGVLPYITLNQQWQENILNYLRHGTEVSSHEQEKVRLERALLNLRKQHLWGDITDAEYRQDKNELERQLNAIAPAIKHAQLPNLERAAYLLTELPALWEHPGVSDKQRETLIREMFQEVRIRGHHLVAIKPKPEYQPLFAYIVTGGVRKCRGERI